MYHTLWKYYCVAKDEEGGCRLCIQVFSMSTDEGGEVKAFSSFSNFVCSSVEVGAYYYGLPVQASMYLGKFDGIWVTVDWLTN